jgi:hypothetical protein
VAEVVYAVVGGLLGGGIYTTYFKRAYQEEEWRSEASGCPAGCSWALEQMRRYGQALLTL